MRQATNGQYPRYMVWENVLGAFSSNYGKDFGIVLNEIVGIAENGAPDVPMPKKGRWTKTGCLYDDMGNWSIAWRVHDAQFWGVPQRRKRIALVADFRGLTATEVLFESESVSGDSDTGGAEREEVAGNIRDRSIEPIPINDKATRFRGGGPTRHGDGAGNGLGVGEPGDPSPTLSTCDRHSVFTFDARGNGDGKTVCTITGDHNNRVTDYTAICVGFSEQTHGEYKPSEQSSTQTARQCKSATDLVIQNAVVRRLTPVECERLQGFPDSWTDIGDWTDSRGRKRKCSDTARYKALGNSIALPFWKWLLGRISEKCGDRATLGSLFDGIGGFPLCWELHNGVGSAIWASEIEEFPIAVTKYHFPDTEEKY